MDKDLKKAMNLLKQEIKYAKTSESDSLTGIIARFNELETVVKNCSIPDVGTRLFGVYSPEDDLLAVHATEQGAEENKANYEKHHGEGFYVDYVMLQP